jgi:hypothetical protein
LAQVKLFVIGYLLQDTRPYRPQDGNVLMVTRQRKMALDLSGAMGSMFNFQDSEPHELWSILMVNNH